jgi:tetratricopeptide (TPR) repeat protein
VKRLLLRESQEQPLLLVFENLHWIDSETQALLDSLVESQGAARLHLLVNYRPEYEHRWGSKTNYGQIRLDTLPPGNTSELLDTLLGDDPALDPLKQLLIKRGNPFFLEESIRTLVETRMLVGARGAYRLTQPVAVLRIPATVQSILASRIDRLPAEEKQLLQMASVIGKHVAFGLLEAVSELPGETLRNTLAHLRAADFLYETKLFPEVEYSFKHALTHEVTYASLLQSRRRELHSCIVEAIERRYANRLTEHVEQLAHHASLGQVWQKAATYLRQAGLKAQGLSAHQAALTWLEKAINALGHLPESPERQEQEIDLRFELRGSLYPLGEFGTMLRYLREAELLATALNDTRRLGLVAIHTGEHFRQTGRFAAARTLAERALAIGDKLQDVPLRLYASEYLGLACHALGDYRRAAELLRAAVPQPRAEERTGALGLVGSWKARQPVVLAWLARCLADSGEFDEGIAAARRAVMLAEGVDNAYILTAACIGLGYICVVKGDLAVAIPTLERAYTVASEMYLRLLRPQATRILGCAHLLAGRVENGLALVREAAGEVESRQLRMQQVTVLNVLAEACLMGDCVEEAGAAAQEALDLARERGQRGEEVAALRVLGEIAARDNSTADAAARHYAGAAALAEALEMRPLVAHCHLGLGKLYRRTGKREQAQEQLTTATTMYREMGMTYWLEKAEKELG